MLDLLWYSEWCSPCHLYVRARGELWVEAARDGKALCHTQWLFSGSPPPRGGSPIRHWEGAGVGHGHQYWFVRGTLLPQPTPGAGTVMGLSCTDPVVLCCRSRRGDGRCSARCGTPQCEYGTHGPEEMLGELVCAKPLSEPRQLQLSLRGQWAHWAAAWRGVGGCLGTGMCAGGLQGLWAPT